CSPSGLVIRRSTRRRSWTSMKTVASKGTTSPTNHFADHRLSGCWGESARIAMRPVFGRYSTVGCWGFAFTLATFLTVVARAELGECEGPRTPTGGHLVEIGGRNMSAFGGTPMTGVVKSHCRNRQVRTLGSGERKTYEQVSHR